MGKLIKFSVVDDSGAALAGQALTAGTTELTTGNAGLVQALLDDGETTIKVNGVVAYQGPVNALQSMEIITKSGVRRT